MANHPIVHVEFPTNNPANAGEFYSALFGWSVSHDEALDYVMFSAESGPSGGFPRPQDQAQPNIPIVYVGTDDIDATLAKAEALGAKIIQSKMPIPGVGYLGFFTDPNGAMMGLFTPEEGTQA